MPEPAAGHPGPHQDLAGYVLGTLDAAESASFARHVEMCERCRRELEELGWLSTRLADIRPAADLPAGLRTQTLAAVTKVADRGVGGGRRWPVVAAIALSVVAALAVLAATPPSDAPAPRTIALVAPDGGAEPRGSARLQRGPLGIVIRLLVADLPAPARGSFYECWYLAPTDTADRPARVSAGTFLTPAGGRAVVTMVTAADPSRYPGIEVTLEPDDGNPARTGTVVLRSRAR